MGRKNSNAGRRKQRGRYPQEKLPAVKAREVPRIPIEEMVLPDGQCRFQTPRRPKARFATQGKAERALRQAQQQRIRTGSAYMEKRVYPCPEGGCGGWHLSSREEFDERVWKQRREMWEQNQPGGQP